MRTSSAIEFFDGSPGKLAAAIGVRTPSIYSWGERVPWRRQIQLERLTGGALRHNPDDVPEDMRAAVPAMLAAPIPSGETRAA